MKKVLYVATVDLHIRTFHIPYLKLLHDNGYEVHVATNGNEQIPYCDVKHQISIERSPFKFGNLKAIRQLKKIIDKEKYDIVHCHTPMGSVVARLAAKSARKKNSTRVIYTAHGFHFYKGAPKLNWILFYSIEKYLAKYTDTLITINKEDYSLAKNKFHKRCKDIQYIPGVGIDITKFDIEIQEQEKNKLIKELKLSKNDYILTCIARLDKNKHQDFLINVMEKISKEHNDIHLLLVGPDELDGYYQKIVKNKSLTKCVHFLGRRENIPEILSITNIVISASLREGLPVNIIESFAAGKPVVVTECRGMSDLIIDGVNGYITYNTSSDKLNDFIGNIMKIYNNINIDFNTINKKRSQDYCIDTITKKIKKIYNIK